MKVYLFYFLPFIFTIFCKLNLEFSKNRLWGYFWAYLRFCKLNHTYILKIGFQKAVRAKKITVRAKYQAVHAWETHRSARKC